MSERGREMADRIMSSLRAGLGVRKAAVAGADLQVTDAVVRQMCDLFADFYDQVDEHITYTTTVLKAMAGTAGAMAGPAQAGWMPYRPEEWQTRLMPKLPPQEANGYTYTRESQ